MTYTNWNIHEFPRENAVSLVRSGYNYLPAVVLASRGIGSAEEAAELLDRSTEKLLDPFDLKDMDKAAARIQQAIDSREKVMIFGDYDVDGMTSTCVMLEFLRSCGLDAGYYIPGRDEDGYGLNNTALDRFARDGVTLVITVDCGVTAVEEVEHAKALGLDIVITDHHECKNQLPDAIAVVDPKRADSSYENKNLAGVGVAFKTICALAGRPATQRLLDRFGDLVALGTVADVVPVTGENSILISRGLAVLEKTKRPGLQTLLKECGAEGRRITTVSVGFTLAPRLNAAGRMGKPELSVQLLDTESLPEAERLSRELCRLNDERRDLVTRIYDEALAIADSAEVPLILAKESWFQGVMGIVAARIAELKMVPTIMICIDENGIGRGSCRSYGCFPLYAALDRCSDLLENFGGHEMAAGITIRRENIEAFRQRFTACYRELADGPSVPALEVDYEIIKPGLLTLPNLEAMTALEPFGNGNMPPVLCLRDAELTFIGPCGTGVHTKLRVSKNGETFDGIFFSHAAGDLPPRGSRVDIAFEPQINEFRGRRSVQLLVVDLADTGERQITEGHA